MYCRVIYSKRKISIKIGGFPLVTLVKKDLLLNGWETYVGMALFVLIAYVVTLPPTFIFMIAFFALVFSSFTYDDKVQVNRFLCSLPIPKKLVVQSRYAYSLLITICTLLFQFIIIKVLQPFLSDSFYVYSFRDLIVLFCIGAVFIALCIPIIYFVRKLVTALGIILVMLAVGTVVIIDQLVTVLQLDDWIIFNELDAGFVLLAEKYFPWQPYLLIVIFTSILVYLSVIVSINIFTKNDI